MKQYLVVASVIVGVIGVVMIGNAWSNPTQTAVRAEEVTPAVSTRQDSLRYTNYTPELFASLKNQRRVLFFSANWCVTCQGADKDISAHTSELPANVTVFNVNYDAEKELRRQYGVTNQHTFVLVDQSGQLLKIWNGGGIDELLSELG